jgi:uncharacterized protein YcbK (DUF882 family)
MSGPQKHLSGPRPGRAVIRFEASALAIAAALFALPGRAQVCEDDAVTEAESGTPSECRATPEVKSEKAYPALDAPARRRGRAHVATTLFSVHSKEALPILTGRLPSAQMLSLFFRCRGFGYQHALDPRLLDAILAAAAEFQSPRVDVISAYRSSKMNDTLAKKGRRVASESRHTAGEAIDFSLATAKARRVAEWLWQRFEGGIGTYDRDDFVHIDVGPKRRWTGR